MDLAQPASSPGKQFRSLIAFGVSFVDGIVSLMWSDQNDISKLLDSTTSASWRHRILVQLARPLWPQQACQRALAFVASQQHQDAVAFADAALAYLDTRYLLDHVERDAIPAQGPAIVIANHPLGAIDSLALISLIGRIRRDFRFMANRELGFIEPLRTHMIEVDVFGQRGGAEVLKAAEAALRRGELVLLFPSGEVSRWRFGRVVESPWQNGFVRLAERTGAPVLPVHLRARNSWLFHTLALLAPALGTAALARETLLAPKRRIEVRIGQPLPALTGKLDAEQRKRWVDQARVTLLGLPNSQSAATPVAQPQRVREWLLELFGAELLCHTADGKQLRLCRLRRGSALLAELGRLRELSFRAAGEGSGLAVDVDRFDADYEHLVLFDPAEFKIAGAYRLGHCAHLIEQGSDRKLYTRSLFDWDERLATLLPQALELGRSFVLPEYQGGRSLDNLWCGIGAYLRRHPEIRYLFGPVSLSAALPQAARDWLTAYYARFFGCNEAWARAHYPAPIASRSEFADLESGVAFGMLKDELRRLGASVPTLYRQYTELTEPGGVRFLAFGVDPEFANCIDGLILVDLQKMKPSKRARYLEERANFPRSLISAHSPD